jgi:hypothetical protein
MCLEQIMNFCRKYGRRSSSPVPRTGDLYRDGRGTISPTMRVARELAQRAGFA